MLYLMILKNMMNTPQFKNSITTVLKFKIEMPIKAISQTILIPLNMVPIMLSFRSTSYLCAEALREQGGLATIII